MFARLYDDFKLAEDMLGAIDNFQVLHEELRKENKIPKQVLKFFRKNLEKSIRNTNRMLKEERWNSKKQKKIRKLSDKLKDAGWKTAVEETPAKAAFLIAEIRKIRESLQNGSLQFNDVESGIHELRRKLRWLSIYPASLDGSIQLEMQKQIPASFRGYVTPEISNSVFNVLPPAKKGLKPIKINSNHFYALSWMIAELGKLKDKGLKIHAVAEALEHEGIESGRNALKKATAMCGQKRFEIKNILQRAEKITHDFAFKDHVLDKLENDIARYV